MANKGLPRLPIEVVIADKNLMGKLWEELSLPQKVAIKVFYGLPLVTPEELTIWAIFNDSVVYDELGYPLATTPVEYIPREYNTFIGIIGRRSGKSSKLGAFIALYEIIFGGHLDHVEEGQDVLVPYIAQDLPTARSNMMSIVLLARKVPKLEAQIVTATRDRIEFKNGIVVVPEPPAIKTGRGFAMPMVIGDEVGFWYRTSEAANPDYEVQRAVSYAQLQFPHAKQLLISTPYTEEGLLFDYWKAGTGGCKLPIADRGEYADTLVIQCSTAAMQNPRIDAKKLQRLQLEDPEAFVRESLARFGTTIMGFLSNELVHNAIMVGVKERTQEMNESEALTPMYVAAMDPAFRHDSFAFSIFHMNGAGEVVQDVLRTWTPEKKLKVSLDPAIIIAEIAALIKQWNVVMVYSDQYQLEALQQLAQLHGFSIIGQDFTGKSKSKMYGSLLQLLRTGKVKLLDIPVIYTQLTQLQKKLNPMGAISISAPPGRHDDVASVVALGTSIALMAFPTVKPIEKELTLFEQGVAHIQQKASADVWI